ncbi:hypothetical protein BROUX41_006217 [Berkeleyomyces rouxiae]|uniref:uncharacterized protein n=1 Tax=Berkeleyomyces rouxiae TaxID=2035830 RepID=UPI003B7BB8F6
MYSSRAVIRPLLRASRTKAPLAAELCVPGLVNLHIRALSSTSSLNAHLSSSSSKARLPISKSKKRVMDGNDRVSSLSRIMTQVRKAVTTDRQIPDLNSFVKGAKSVGLLENRAKVYHRCVESIIETFKTSPDDWSWIRGWASKNNLTPKIIYESAIAYHSATPPDDTSPAVTTTALLLLYAAGVQMNYTPALLSFAHLTILSGSHTSTMNIFMEGHAAFSRLLRSDDPDAMTIEAKYKISAISNHEDAHWLLVKALKTSSFEWKPMALVLLARLHVEEANIPKARVLLEQAISEFDYSIAHDDLAELDGNGADQSLKETVVSGLTGSPTGLRSLAKIFMDASLEENSQSDGSFYAKAMENIRFARERLV